VGRGRREAWSEYAHGALWVLPGVSIVVAIALGTLLSKVRVGAHSPLHHVLFAGTVNDARTLLIGISGAVITVIALILGLTLVALQLSSTQYSPRVLRNFLRDRPNQLFLSVIVATFAYSAAGLYTVGVSGEQDARFGMRQLAIHRLTVVLCTLASRPLGDCEITGPEGRGRVVVSAPSFAAYVDLACGQIRRYGAAEPTVTAALLAMLRDVQALVSDPDRDRVLAGEARLILSDAERATCQPADLRQVREQAAPLLTGDT
jgi:uncharacterized membrane protein